MEYEYFTERLFLKTSHPDDAGIILNFLNRNRNHFEPFEDEKQPKFYTVDYQKRLLTAESLSFHNNSFIRYYIYNKNNPLDILGTFSFIKKDFIGDPIMRLGYKTDHTQLRKGYMYEALSFIIPRIFLSGCVCIEAHVQPDNTPSVSLLKKLGFSLYEDEMVYRHVKGVNIPHQIYFLGSDISVANIHQ